MRGRLAVPDRDRNCLQFRASGVPAAEAGPSCPRGRGLALVRLCLSQASCGDQVSCPPGAEAAWRSVGDLGHELLLGDIYVPRFGCTRVADF